MKIGKKIIIENKKIYFVLLIIVVLAALVGLAEFLYLSRAKKEEPIIPQKKEKTKIEQQLEELEKLRKDTPPLTEEQIKIQSEELKKLRKKTKPLTKEALQKQIEELKKLRLQ